MEYIEDREQTWTEIHTTETCEDRDGCRSLCNSRSKRLEYGIYEVLGGGLMAQAVRCSPPTSGVPTLRLFHSMWVSWWTKWGLVRFFAGFLPFSPTTNFIPPFLHTHLIHFVSFHQPLWWCVRRGRPAPLPFTDLQYRGFIASHPSTRPCVGHELRIFIYEVLGSFNNRGHWCK